MNRRAFLKKARVVSAAAVPALYGNPGDAAAPEPVTVLVTSHSVTSNTEKMAQGVADGVKAVAGRRGRSIEIKFHASPSGWGA